MIVAIFGVLLLVNRQTGGMFEGFFMFIFPIPMVAFSAKYGWKDSLPVFFCTILIAFLFGTFTGMFYAIGMSFVGMVYGSCIRSGRDMNRTLILVMILSAAMELLCTVALATFAGFDLNADIMAMQETMNTMLAQAGVDTSTGILSYDYLRRMYIISTGFVGAMEGLIVYYLSYAILKKLRYPIRKPQPLTSYYPSRISGVIALVLVFIYAYTVAKPETFFQFCRAEYPAVRRNVRRDLSDLLRIYSPSHDLQCLSSPAQDPWNDHLFIPYNVHLLYPDPCRLSLYQRQSS